MTDVGLVRNTNEDNFLIDEELCLVMVADGMGGHELGELASARALMAVRQFLSQVVQQRVATSIDNDENHPGAGLNAAAQSSDPDATWADETVPAVGTMFDAIESANSQVYAENVAREMTDGIGMGTTLTGMWRPTLEGPIIVFHVGDSRFYRFRAGELTLLTRDQTAYQKAIDAGTIDNLPKRNMLLQAIGPSAHVTPEVRAHAVEPGDRFLLCSDGLHGSIAHAEMENVVGTTGLSELESACKRLIDIAKADGGRDNITVILMLTAQ